MYTSMPAALRSSVLASANWLPAISTRATSCIIRACTMSTKLTSKTSTPLLHFTGLPPLPLACESTDVHAKLSGLFSLTLAEADASIDCVMRQTEGRYSSTAEVTLRGSTLAPL